MADDNPDSAPLSQYERELRGRLADQVAYFGRLKEKGGRPALPPDQIIETLKSPGHYRRAIYFWQSNGMDTFRGIAGGQNRHWDVFRHQQAAVRKGGQGLLARHREEVRACLRKIGFDAPRGLVEGIVAEPASQGPLATWTEYLYFQACQYDRDLAELRGTGVSGVRSVARYQQLWRQMVDAVCEEAEAEAEAGAGGGQISGPATAAHLRRMSAFSWKAPELAEKVAQQLMRSAGAALEIARRAMEREPDDEARIARFKAAAAEYLRLEGKHKAVGRLGFDMAGNSGWKLMRIVDRDQMLVEWILEQMLLIEQEEREKREVQEGPENQEDQSADQVAPSIRDAVESSLQYLSSQAVGPKGVDLTPVFDHVPILRREPGPGGSTFHPFSNLPFELRQKVWRNALPPRRRGVHFFEILNTSQGRSFWNAGAWSSMECSLRPTTRLDSAYLTVHTLLWTCSESRAVACRAYSGGPSASSPTTTTTPSTPGPPPPDFASGFDWIPEDDLVVLCLPPRFVPGPLPPPGRRHCIDLTRGDRHVAFSLCGLPPSDWMPMTVPLDGFLGELCGRGAGTFPRATYIITDLKALPPPEECFTGRDGRLRRRWRVPGARPTVRWALLPPGRYVDADDPAVYAPLTRPLSVRQMKQIQQPQQPEPRDEDTSTTSADPGPVWQVGDSPAGTAAPSPSSTSPTDGEGVVPRQRRVLGVVDPEDLMLGPSQHYTLARDTGEFLEQDVQDWWNNGFEWPVILGWLEGGWEGYRI